MAKPIPGTVCRTLTEAYQQFGITVANPRAAWSAQGDDGTVVLTVWANRFADPERRVYENYDVPFVSWTRLWQNRRRIEHLKHAKRHRDGLFESIIIFQGDEPHNKIIRREIGPTRRGDHAVRQSILPRLA